MGTTKLLHPNQLMEYSRSTKIFHPIESRIPITLDSIVKTGDLFTWSNTTESAIIQAVASQQIAWANLPVALLKKLGLTDHNVIELRNSWVNCVAKHFNTTSTENRVQKIHNKANSRSTYWHKDNYSPDICLTTIYYQPKQNVQHGSLEIAVDKSKSSILRIPNNSNSHTLITLRDDLFEHRGQKRTPIISSKEMNHGFMSTHRFPSLD